MFWERNLNDDEDDDYEQRHYSQKSSTFSKIDCVNDPEDDELLICNVKKQLYNPETKQYDVIEEEQKMSKLKSFENFSNFVQIFNPVIEDLFFKNFEENINQNFEKKFNNFQYNTQTQKCRNDPKDSQYLICDINKKFYNPETKQQETITEQKRIKISNEKIENEMIKQEPQKNQNKIYEI